MPVIDRKDPKVRYTVADLAALLRLAVSSTWTLAQSGWFSGSAS